MLQYNLESMQTAINEGDAERVKSIKTKSLRLFTE